MKTFKIIFQSCRGGKVREHSIKVVATDIGAEMHKINTDYHLGANEFIKEVQECIGRKWVQLNMDDLW